MDKYDLMQKCSRAMIESGPEVMIALTVPPPVGLKPKATTLDLGLASDGGPRAKIVGVDNVGGKPMVKIHVKAAVLLKVLQ